MKVGAGKLVGSARRRPQGTPRLREVPPSKQASCGSKGVGSGLKVVTNQGARVPCKFLISVSIVNIK